jgi:hypothetical protein
MSHASVTGHRWATAAVLVVGGGGLAAATWIGGEHGLALGLVAFYAVVALGAFVWSGRDGDVAAIMRAGGDERQRRLDMDATALSGLAMGVAAVIGAIVSAAQHGGDIGPYGVICVVGGVSYVLSVAVLRRRTAVG